PMSLLPRTFTRKSHLLSHLITHTTVRDFPCPQCPTTFARRHDLQRHLRATH
ncbi:hypothetical protein BC829DRAFT_356442, partial [Chytridium lagenaria]